MLQTKKKTQTHIHQIRQKKSTFFFYLRTYLHLFAEFSLWLKKFRGQQNTTNDLSQFIRIQTNPHRIFAYIQKKTVVTKNHDNTLDNIQPYKKNARQCTFEYSWNINLVCRFSSAVVSVVVSLCQSRSHFNKMPMRKRLIWTNKKLI